MGRARAVRTRNLAAAFRAWSTWAHNRAQRRRDTAQERAEREQNSAAARRARRREAERVKHERNVRVCGLALRAAARFLGRVSLAHAVRALAHPRIVPPPPHAGTTAGANSPGSPAPVFSPDSAASGVNASAASVPAVVAPAEPRDELKENLVRLAMANQIAALLLANRGQQGVIGCVPADSDVPTAVFPVPAYEQRAAVVFDRSSTRGRLRARLQMRRLGAAAAQAMEP